MKLDKSLGPLDLVLDIGCYHSLALWARIQYLNNLKSLLVEGGHFLIYGANFPIDDHPPGITQKYLKVFSTILSLQNKKEILDHPSFPGFWAEYCNE